MLTIDSSFLAGISSRPDSDSLPDSTPGHRGGVVGLRWFRIEETSGIVARGDRTRRGWMNFWELLHIIYTWKGYSSNVVFMSCTWWMSFGSGKHSFKNMSSILKRVVWWIVGGLRVDDGYHLLTVWLSRICRSNRSKLFWGRKSYSWYDMICQLSHDMIWLFRKWYLQGTSHTGRFFLRNFPTCCMCEKMEPSGWLKIAWREPDGNSMDLSTVHDLGNQTPKIDGKTKQKSVVLNWSSNFQRQIGRFCLW